MIVLALDTAGVDCAVALYDSDGDRVLAEVGETIGRGHAERLMEILDRALEKAGITLAQVGRVAVTVGPGSFTGIRVGVAAARGFSLSLGIPAVGVTTLEVLAAAERLRGSGEPILAAIDAKRGEVYLQSFDAAGRAQGEPQGLGIDEARTVAAGFAGVVVGSAAPLLAGEAAAAASPDTFPIAVVARLGAAKAAGARPKPLYLREVDAKPQAGFAVMRS